MPNPVSPSKTRTPATYVVRSSTSNGQDNILGVYLATAMSEDHIITTEHHGSKRYEGCETAHSSRHETVYVVLDPHSHEKAPIPSAVSESVKDDLCRQAQVHIRRERCNPGQLDKTVIAELYKPCTTQWAKVTKDYASGTRNAVESCIRAILEERKELEGIQPGF